MIEEITLNDLIDYFVDNFKKESAKISVQLYSPLVY